MRSMLVVCVLFLLAGCTTYSAMRDAWKWDPTRNQEPLRLVLAPQEHSALSNRVADLQLQRNGIRSLISSESDIWVRQGLYADLHRVGQELSPLERQLAAAAPAR